MSELVQVLELSRDEAALVTELQAGSNEAFDCLVTHYHGAVYGLVYRMLGDAADAADTTQEVFLKAFRGIRGFRQASSVRTWLYRIAIREALNQRRWWRRHRRQETSIDASEGGRGPAAELEAMETTPFEMFAAREAQALVRLALGQVPRVFRSAVILHDLESLSYEEVAEVLEISIGTAKSRILRGRQALRELLAPLLDGRQKAAQTAAIQRRRGAGMGLPAGARRIGTAFDSRASIRNVVEGGEG